MWEVLKVTAGGLWVVLGRGPGVLRFGVSYRLKHLLPGPQLQPRWGAGFLALHVCLLQVGGP